MKKMSMILGLVLMSFSFEANAYVWLQGLHCGTTVLTWGNREAQMISSFLTDSSSGHLKCGVDDKTHFSICQVQLQENGSFLEGFRLEYNPPGEVYSDINDGDVAIYPDQGLLEVRILSASQVSKLQALPAFQCTPSYCRAFFNSKGQVIHR